MSYKINTTKFTLTNLFIDDKFMEKIIFSWNFSGKLAFYVRYGGKTANRWLILIFLSKFWVLDERRRVETGLIIPFIDYRCEIAIFLFFRWSFET